MNENNGGGASIALVFCPACAEQSRTSTVQENGSMQTLMHCPAFYDEQGRRHRHDSNRVTDDFRCSNGHRWVSPRYNTCWCGWTRVGRLETIG